MITAADYRKMKPRSEGEETLASQLKTYRIDFVREYRFAPERKWRADFYLPQYKILIEAEGGTWISGRHNRGSSIEADMEKYNTATALGFRVFRYTTDMITKGIAIQQIREVIKE